MFSDGGGRVHSGPGATFGRTVCAEGGLQDAGPAAGGSDAHRHAPDPEHQAAAGGEDPRYRRKPSESKVKPPVRF